MVRLPDLCQSGCIQEEIPRQGYHGKGTHMRIFQDCQLLFPFLIRMQCIGGIHKAVQMNPARHDHRQHRAHKGKAHLSITKFHTDSPPGIQKSPDHHADYREEAQRVFHILWIPCRLGHGNFRIHGYRNDETVYNCFHKSYASLFLFLILTGIVYTISAASSACFTRPRFILPSISRYCSVS